MTRKIFLIVFLLFVGCDIDEDAPDYPTGLRGFLLLIMVTLEFKSPGMNPHQMM